MTNKRMMPSVEPLERRLLMAVLAALPAEATAEYAPPAPHGMMDMDHPGQPAAAVETASDAKSVADLSLSIERGATTDVLMVQFHDLQQSLLVRISGGDSAWTDGDGAAHFEIPHGAQQIDLGIVAEDGDTSLPLLRIELNDDGQIVSYVHLTSTDEASAPQPEPAVVVEQGKTHTGFGLAQFTATGADAIHHGTGAVTLFDVSQTVQFVAPHSVSNHGMPDDGVHPSDVQVSMPVASGMESQLATGESNSLAMSTGRSSRNAAFSEPEIAAGRTAADEPASDIDHETLEAVFASWAGGEDVAPAETIAAIAAEQAPGVTPIQLAPPAVLPQSDLVYRVVGERHDPLLRETFAPQFAAEEPDAAGLLAEEPAGEPTWRVGVALIVSAGCAAGAYALERQAREADAELLKPARVRRRPTSAPATGAMAKAAM